jgi:hypothetical protein
MSSSARFGAAIVCGMAGWSGSQAGTLDPAASFSTRGDAMAQRFVAPNVAIVRSAVGATCVATGVIDIEGSSYSGPDGAPVPLDAVVRSPAASVQFLSASPDDPVRARVQFKYPLDATRPVVMTADAVRHDLTRFIEPSGDSLLVTDATIVAVLIDGARQGRRVALSGFSSDTDRLVVDTLPAMDLIGFEACRTGLPGLPDELLPVPATIPQLDYVVERSPAHEATPAQARACGIEPAAGAAYVGRVRDAAGFTTPSDAVIVVFDNDGPPGLVSIPGIFEARGKAGEYAVDISIAADVNDPMTENRVKGCLGLASTPLCDMPVSPEAGHRRIGLCFGSIAMGSLAEFDTLQAVPAAGDPGSVIASEPGDASPGSPVTAGGGLLGGPKFPTGSPLGGGGGGGGSGGGGGGGGSGGGGGGGGPVAAIPLPPAILLSLGALGRLAAAGRRRRRGVDVTPGG